MEKVSPDTFGLVIAYLIPGFVSVWGAAYHLPMLREWLAAIPGQSPTVGGFLYTTIAAIGAGVTISAVRWAFLDTLHHATGIPPPQWDFARLTEHLEAFESLVHDHYRFYQFYANMFVALAVFYFSRLSLPGTPQWPAGVTAGFVVTEGVLFLGSRDALEKYYQRGAQLLGTLNEKGASDMTNGKTHGEKKTPRTEQQKPKESQQTKAETVKR